MATGWHGYAIPAANAVSRSVYSERCSTPL